MKDKAIGNIFADQTEHFPKKSSHRNQYIMVLIDVDSDAILVEPTKNRTSGKMIQAYQTLIDRSVPPAASPNFTSWTTNALKTSGTPLSSMV